MLSIVLFLSGTEAQKTEGSENTESLLRPAEQQFFSRYCIDCHGGDSPSAELSVESLLSDSVAPAGMLRQRKSWDSVIRVIMAGEMPPSDAQQPDAAETAAFVDRVRSIFDHADASAPPDPGRVTMRRLNRTEYRNTIRDLMGVDFDPTVDFPSDDIGYGFDNIGDVLSVSPMLMERYLAAAEQIVDRAIVDTPPPIIRRHIDSVHTEPASADLAALIEDGFRPIRSDGTLAIEIGPVHTAYHFEPEQEYLFQARMYATGGIDESVRVSILVQGKNLEDPTAGEQLSALHGTVRTPAKILKTVAVNARTPQEAETVEVLVPALANRQRMMVALNRPVAGDAPVTLWVKWLKLDGPLDTRPLSQRMLLATSDHLKAQNVLSMEQRTGEVLERMMRRAYRRPVTAEELRRAVQMVKSDMDEGESWESAVKFAMQAVLCSPKFLFRMELDEDPHSPEVRQLDEFQLASRLAYFLWSSMPDDQLLDLAQENRLSAELDAQVARMLADSRAESLVGNFGLQWLQLMRIETFSPDPERFPTFNPALRSAMLEETKRFLHAIIAQDLSILALLDADFTFMNETLAQHYGVADTNGNWMGREPLYPEGQPIRGDQFVRVLLPDRLRGGLLTQASVLAVTSNPTRTSPVKRGKWILEQILGTPPPPPPPNVPELPEEEESGAASLTLREKLEIHRRNPACANCHTKMDAMGFALENFDAIGAYRSRDGRFLIDATGEFSDGTRFSGPVELKEFLMTRQDEFVRCLVEKLLVYGLGRGLEYYDRPTTEKIVRAMPGHDYKFSGLVREIVHSDAFRQRRGGR
jgi:mono/diheme cytochrome c family protein